MEERGGTALLLKSFYRASPVSISFGLSLSKRGRGVSRGTNHTGLHSISISLCCHGSRGALSRVKISHCTMRGLPCLNRHERTCTHTICTHTHSTATGEGEWSVHHVMNLSHTFTWHHCHSHLSQLCARVRLAFKS